MQRKEDQTVREKIGTRFRSYEPAGRRCLCRCTRGGDGARATRAGSAKCGRNGKTKQAGTEVVGVIAFHDKALARDVTTTSRNIIACELAQVQGNNEGRDQSLKLKFWRCLICRQLR